MTFIKQNYISKNIYNFLIIHKLFFSLFQNYEEQRILMYVKWPNMLRCGQLSARAL